MLVSSKNSCQFIPELSERYFGHLDEQSFGNGCVITIIELISVLLLESSIQVIPEIAFLAYYLMS